MLPINYTVPTVAVITSCRDGVLTMYIQHGWLWSLTQLYNGERRSKSDMIFHALGHQDELNAVLGVVREHCNAANNGLNDMSV